MIKITQVKSSIGQTKRQKATLIALGIKKMGQSIKIETSAQTQGMVNKIAHLVTIEEV
jgi:large subunit ribosomal protein L30